MLAAIDWSFWFNIVLTVVTAWLGIYFTVRKKYPEQILYLQEKPIRLFDDIIKNVPDLEIQYQKKPIQQNLTVMRGYFLNSGSKDISPEMIDNPLRARLPEDCSWLEAKVLHGSDGKASATIIDPQTIEITFGLFRREEYLKLESLISRPHGKAPVQLKFSHRIADTASLQFSNIPTIQQTTMPAEITLFILFSLGCLIGYVARLFKPTLFSEEFLRGGLVISAVMIFFSSIAIFVVRKHRKTRRLLKLTE